MTMLNRSKATLSKATPSKATRNHRPDRSIHLYMKIPGVLLAAGLVLALPLLWTQRGFAQQATPTADGASPLIPRAAQPTAPPASEPEPPSIGGITVRIVMAPVTVTDHDGSLVEGLQPTDFRLYDNGKLQRITEDLTTHPLSLVVAVQANGQVEKILPQIQKLGSLLQAQVLGDEGEVAVLEFDHRVQKLTDFTSDPDKMTAALKGIKAGSWTSRLNDAAMEGVVQAAGPTPGLDAFQRRRHLIGIGREVGQLLHAVIELQDRDFSFIAQYLGLQQRSQLLNLGKNFFHLAICLHGHNQRQRMRRQIFGDSLQLAVVVEAEVCRLQPFH